jgi:hypothetical protein
MVTTTEISRYHAVFTYLETRLSFEGHYILTRFWAVNVYEEYIQSSGKTAV